jgi:hypothetical protein
MAIGEGTVGLVSSRMVDEECSDKFRVNSARLQHKSNVQSAAGVNSRLPKTAFYVRYKDHLFVRHSKTSDIRPVVREAVGWVKEETDEAMLLECDRSLLAEAIGFNGLAILKNCIILMVPLNLEHILNPCNAKPKNRVCVCRPANEKLTPKISEQEPKN